MSRTTTAARVNKASTTAKKRANIEVPKGWKVQRGGNRDTLASKTRDSKFEKSFQLAIERMQLTNASKNWEKSKLMKKTDDELERIAKLELKAKELKVNFVSDYKTLKELFNNQLSHLTEEMFIVDAEGQIERFIKKSRGEISTAQKVVIVEYYNGKANRDYSIVDNVRKLLVHKGALKPTLAEKTLEAAVEKHQTEKQAEPANVTE